METDNFGNPFPSREGAYEQLIVSVIDPYFEDRWYSFDEITKPTNSGNTIKGVRATSFDEDGEEDQTYVFWWA